MFRWRRRIESTPKKILVSGLGKFAIHVFGNELISDKLENGKCLWIRDANQNLIASIAWHETTQNVKIRVEGI